MRSHVTVTHLSTFGDLKLGTGYLSLTMLLKPFGIRKNSPYFNSILPFFNFVSYKCQYRQNELLALQLAKEEKVTEIVDFLGAKLKGRDACIFMEFVAGKDNDGECNEYIKKGKLFIKNIVENGGKFRGI